jgi:hypothetical protein
MVVRPQVKVTVAGEALVKVTEAGDTLHVIPKGLLKTPIVTVPVSPPSGVMDRVVLAVGAEFESVILGGFPVRLKSATAMVIGADVEVV